MRIGILQTGHLPDGLEGVQPSYPEMFARLLDGHGFDFTTWAVVDGQMPPDIHAAEGWLITGSRHGAYEDHAWIPPLEDFIRTAHAARAPMVGICFGHQIIAQALGGRVEKFAGGWAVGRRPYAFGGELLHINAWHQDQVTEPPKEARTLAENDFCTHAALAYGDHMLTVQPHPEFAPEFIDALIATRGRGVVPDPLLDQAEADLALPLDSAKMGGMLAETLRRAHAA